MNSRFLAPAIIGLCFLLLAISCKTAMADLQGKVIVFHAGSLSVPFEAMEKAFEAEHPAVDIQREAGGSTKMARLISEVGKPADIMASADYVVIDKNLIPDFASTNILFASNQLVLCFTDKSRYADEVNKDNWFDILQRKDVVWGHSDPNLDPCGYRSLMLLQLAEKFHGIDGLSDKLIANRPEKNIRPKSVELISLLESGNMDYAWEYLSVAVQHNLNYIVLDDHVNLGNYKMDPFYKQAVVTVTGSKPGETVDRVGSSITYGLTLIKDAPNKEAAEAFMAYIIDPEGGLKILKDMGQPPFVPARVSNKEMYDALPASLKPLVEIQD